MDLEALEESYRVGKNRENRGNKIEKPPERRKLPFYLLDLPKKEEFELFDLLDRTAIPTQKLFRGIYGTGDLVVELDCKKELMQYAQQLCGVPIDTMYLGLDYLDQPLIGMRNNSYQATFLCIMSPLPKHGQDLQHYLQVQETIRDYFPKGVMEMVKAHRNDEIAMDSERKAEEQAELERRKKEENPDAE